MARRPRGRIPAAGCNRAGNAARRPFLLSAPGLRVFLAWPALLGRDSRAKGDSLPKAARGAMQSIGNTAAGIAAALTPLAKPKIQQQRGTLFFFTGSKHSEGRWAVQWGCPIQCSCGNWS